MGGSVGAPFPTAIFYDVKRSSKVSNTGNLPSTVSCDPTTPSLNPSGLYSISGRLLASSCQVDTTGLVLSVTSADFYDGINGCGESEACKAISWRYGTCYQKSAIGKLVASDAVSSFTAADASNAPTCPDWNGDTYTNTGNLGDFTIECCTDYPGIGDMGSSTQPTFQTYLDTCSQTSGCVTVVCSGSACSLKNAMGPATPNPNVQTAVKVGTTFTPSNSQTPSAAQTPSCPADDGTEYTSGRVTYSIHCDADYYGGDLTSTSTNSFADCISGCDANEQCIDVSYVSGSCYLKSRLTTLSNKAGVWTAVQEDITIDPSNPNTAPSSDTLTVTCPSTNSVSYTSHVLNTDTSFEISCGTDYYGGDLLSTETDTLQACVDACASNSECVALSYRGVGCYLKSTLNTPAVDPSSDVIGAKLVAPASGPSTTTTTTSSAATTTTTTTTTSSSPTPTPLVNLNSCTDVFLCGITSPISCSSAGTCYCLNSPTYAGGFCTDDLNCNTQCAQDADCGAGYICATDTSCENSNASMCIQATSPTCANTATAKYMFAKVKRETVWAGPLGAYIEKVAGSYKKLYIKGEKEGLRT